MSEYSPARDTRADVVEPAFLESCVLSEFIGDDIIIFEDGVERDFFMIAINGRDTMEMQRVEIDDSIEYGTFDGQIKERSSLGMDRYFACQDVLCDAVHKLT